MVSSLRIFRLSITPGWGDFLALLAGALLPLAFAPFSFYPLAVLAPAMLFYLWWQLAPARAAWRGFLFGLGQFGVGVSWLYVALHEYGNMPAPLALLALLLFIAYLAAYPALLGALQARYVRRTWQGAWVLPALWVLAEWLRGTLFTGFPWLPLGYTQVDTPLAGYAPVLGVYGVSFVAALSAGLLAAAWRSRGWWVYFTVFAGLWVAGAGLHNLAWTQPAGAPIKVALVQGNVPIVAKWQPRYRQAIIQRYIELTLEHPQVNLVVWPEAALPLARDELDASLLPRLQETLQARHQELLFGLVEREQQGSRAVYYNSLLKLGAQEAVYRKHHLVPFGEYLPLAGLLSGLLDYLHIPMSDFSPGPANQPPIMVAGHMAGVSICYEFAFGNEIRQALPAADFLVNVSEDAWYGDSFAPHQHQQMVRMRALESGRPLLRVTNTGVTAIIDHHGQSLARLPQFRDGVLLGAIQPMQGTTPYVRWGDMPVILGLLLLLVPAGFLASRRK